MFFVKSAFSNKNSIFEKQKQLKMTRLNIALDQSTLFGKNFYNFLVGMNYVAENEPSVVCIDEKTTEGRKILNFLYESGFVDTDNEYIMSPDADLERAITAEELLVGIKQDLRAKFHSRAL